MKQTLNDREARILTNISFVAWIATKILAVAVFAAALLFVRAGLLHGGEDGFPAIAFFIVAGVLAALPETIVANEVRGQYLIKRDGYSIE